jgi:mannose-6-phosphate isomerase-like protein (cupin superfamily)
MSAMPIRQPGSDPMPDASQQFNVSHLDEADFKSGGLRDYSVYRDLGVAAATQGLATAHVIRMTAPFTPDLGLRHHHDVQFQLVYVLKGWFKTDFEGQGVQLMKTGSCWIQPPGIRHTVVGWSDDCELLEVILPAEHVTVNDD